MSTIVMSKDVGIGVIKLIDVGAQRGAWRGDEMMNVGILRQQIVEAVEAELHDEEKSAGIPMGGEVPSDKD